MQDSSLRELLSVNETQALQFFFSGLKDVSGSSARQDELLYNASVLAHYSQVSCGHEGEDIPCPRTLMCIFDNHYNNLAMFRDENMFEVVACQTLMLTGFFGSRMGGRHNLNWYKRICAGFFMSASHASVLVERREFFARMASRVVLWADRQARLEREIRDTPFLLRLPSEGGLQ